MLLLTGAGAFFRNPETLAACARFVTPATPAHMKALDLLFTRLKVGATNGTNTLAILDVLVVRAKAAVADQWINLIQNTFNPSIAASAPTFSTVTGAYTTDGVDDDINTNFNPFAGGVKYVRDDAMVIFDMLTQGTHANAIAGWNDGTDGNSFNPRNASDAQAFRINQTATATDTTARASDAGIYLMSRSGASALEFYIDGVTRTIETNPTAASSALNDHSFSIGRTAAATFGSGIFGGYAFGSHPTASQAADISAAFIEYNTAFAGL